MSPEKVVQKQLDAYNARDLDTYMSCFADNITAIDFRTGETTLSGSTAFRERYKEIFDNSPQIYCKLINRITLSNLVFDREEVTGRLGRDVFEVVAIYEVEHGLIQKVTFVKTADQ
ncbi:MAG: nuclear transport factor 2 family protein [Saprospiraceae bacterium]|jgi:hypothetical protein|nr:nuclear transport factor 2 family protein [Saprospiraceae bacterium]